MNKPGKICAITLAGFQVFEKQTRIPLIKGGIRFDQGFQQLPAGRRMTVSPISKIVHDELLGLFFERAQTFDEVKRLSVRV